LWPHPSCSQAQKSFRSNDVQESRWRSDCFPEASYIELTDGLAALA
jgi:hypothetical protein